MKNTCILRVSDLIIWRLAWNPRELVKFNNIFFYELCNSGRLTYQWIDWNFLTSFHIKFSLQWKYVNANKFNAIALRFIYYILSYCIL